MIDERELLERAATRYTLEPGIVERVYRRRDRHRRQQRITALVIGLIVAVAGVGIAIRVFQAAERPKPTGPSITAENVRIVAMSDAQRIPGTWDLDLDTGKMGWEEIRATGGTADLWLNVLDASTRALMDPDEVGTVELAYLGQVDFESISPHDFEGFPWTRDPIRGTDDARNQLFPGAVFAVRTTEGNYSKVQVLGDDGDDLWLRWLTYEGDQVGGR